MNIVLYSFTRRGAGLCSSIAAWTEEEGHMVQAYGMDKYCCDFNNLSAYARLDPALVQIHFNTADALVFIGAAGIAVRKIAPLIASKDKDPAVVVVDEAGKFVIPILSGHIGGANKLALYLSGRIGAVPVITTATDINQRFAVDSWASENGYAIVNKELIKDIAAELLDHKPVGLYSDFDITGEIPGGLCLGLPGSCHPGICISLDGSKQVFNPNLNIVPPIVTVGIGCRKNISFQDLEEMFLTTLENNHISIVSVKIIASIDLKQEEKALSALCEKYGLQSVFYSAEQLMEAQGDFSASPFVDKVTGADNVCERAAWLAAGSGRLIVKKTTGRGVAIAVAIEDFKVRFAYGLLNI